MKNSNRAYTLLLSLLVGLVTIDASAYDHECDLNIRNVTPDPVSSPTLSAPTLHYRRYRYPGSPAYIATFEIYSNGTAGRTVNLACVEQSTARTCLWTGVALYSTFSPSVVPINRTPGAKVTCSAYTTEIINGMTIGSPASTLTAY